MDISTYQFSLLYAWYSWPNVILPLVGGYLMDSVFGIRLGTNIFAFIICTKNEQDYCQDFNDFHEKIPRKFAFLNPKFVLFFKFSIFGEQSYSDRPFTFIFFILNY